MTMACPTRAARCRKKRGEYHSASEDGFEDIDVETGELMGPPAWEKKKKKKGKNGHS